MKTIGLIGGMSWESSVLYYQILNDTVKERLGGLHSARCILYSVDFQEIEAFQANGEWEKSARVLIDTAKSLERAGADFIVLCTNTMHKVATEIQGSIGIPFIHIADCTARALIEKGIRKVGLLGTRYTMEEDFYKLKIMEHGIDVLVPAEDDIGIINDIIYNELCLGVVSEDSKKRYLAIMDKLLAKGAEGVILGCTEIGLLVKQSDTLIPLFDTAEIHAKTAALMGIGEYCEEIES